MNKAKKLEPDYNSYVIIGWFDGYDVCEPYMDADLRSINVELAEHCRRREARNRRIRIQRRDDVIGYVGAFMMMAVGTVYMLLWLYGIV